MKIGLHQSARMEQRLIQSPQMIQAMQILQLNMLDLQERIEQEMIENPLLESQESGPTASEASSEAEVPERPDSPEPPSEGLEKMLDDLERYERDYGDGRSTSNPVQVDRDRKYEALQNTPCAPKSLAEALQEQLPFLALDDEQRLIVEYLACSLGEHGYLQSSHEELAQELAPDLGRPVAVEEIVDALAQLRHVSHPAMGAHNLREALLLQLDDRGDERPLVRSLIEDHLDDITVNRLPRIARATGRSIEEIKAALDVIRGLDPSPGSDYSEVLASTIMPEVIVEQVNGSYQVRLERQRSPELVVSPAYRRLLEQAGQDKKVHEWLKKRLESARWFIDAVQQRQNTLERISIAIFERQRDFLDRGVSSLHPLRMQEVADEVGVHISTVSRGVSGKHAQTPRGIYPLKYFFTGGTAKDTGELTSQRSIKERIRQLIAAEDKAKPMSDDLLAAKLSELDGIKIARRTVSKYRKALDIPSSSQRRAY